MHHDQRAQWWPHPDCPGEPYGGFVVPSSHQAHDVHDTPNCAATSRCGEAGECRAPPVPPAQVHDHVARVGEVVQDGGQAGISRSRPSALVGDEGGTTPDQRQPRDQVRVLTGLGDPQVRPAHTRGALLTGSHQTRTGPGGVHGDGTRVPGECTHQGGGPRTSLPAGHRDDESPTHTSTFPTRCHFRSRLPPGSRLPVRTRVTARTGETARTRVTVWPSVPHRAPTPSWSPAPLRSGVGDDLS